MLGATDSEHMYRLLIQLGTDHRDSTQDHETQEQTIDSTQDHETHAGTDY